MLEMALQHKQSAVWEKQSLLASPHSPEIMLGGGKLSSFTILPIAASLLSRKLEKVKDIPLCTVRCGEHSMHHKKNPEPRKETSSHIKDFRLRITRCSWP